MVRIAGGLLVTCTLAALAACTSTARLYPANDLAASTGILTLSYENTGLGSGGVTVRMPDGEVLKGEYTTVNTDSTSFGTIMSGGQVSTYHGLTSGGGSPGTASLIGNRGTLMDCEYIAGDFSGTGACRTSKGGLYRLHF
jgi:hypothetical protein